MNKNVELLIQAVNIKPILKIIKNTSSNKVTNKIIENV